MREQKLAKSLQALAVEAFPDDTDVVWRALAYEHYRDVTYVEAEAEPATVGYPRFRFVVLWPADEPEVVGCYCLEEGRWQLLFGEDPLAAASAPIELPEQAGGCAFMLFLLALLALLPWMKLVTDSA